jgi:hypothetical protein
MVPRIRRTFWILTDSKGTGWPCRHRPLTHSLNRAQRDLHTPLSVTPRMLRKNQRGGTRRTDLARMALEPAMMGTARVNRSVR